MDEELTGKKDVKRERKSREGGSLRTTYVEGMESAN